MLKSFDDSWETATYSQGKQLNRYPFSELVSHVLRLYGGALKAGQRPRVLELGSGGGNNLVFLASEGFETYGIDGSPSACRAAESLLTAMTLSASITVGDFICLPFPDGFFDLVVDRESVCHNRKAAILEIAGEVRRCLRSGGRFLSFAFSTEHGCLVNDGGESIEPNTYARFKTGSFAGTGVCHFFTEEEAVGEYFRGLDVEFVCHHRNDHRVPHRDNQYAEFILCGRKP